MRMSLPKHGDVVSIWGACLSYFGKNFASWYGVTILLKELVLHSYSTNWHVNIIWAFIYPLLYYFFTSGTTPLGRVIITDVRTSVDKLKAYLRNGYHSAFSKFNWPEFGSIFSKRKKISYENLNVHLQVVYPSEDPRVKKYHDAKYRIFRELYEQQLSHRSIMAQALI